MRHCKTLLLLVLFVGFFTQTSKASLHHPNSFLTPQADTAKVDSADKDDDGLPLEPARTVSFTTHEGTWMSVDVHPSGEKIVFDMMGNLYTIPIEGGQATQITEGMAFDAHPRYSPSGEYILFISDRSGGANVWYKDVDTGKPFRSQTGKTHVTRQPSGRPMENISSPQKAPVPINYGSITVTVAPV